MVIGDWSAVGWVRLLILTVLVSNIGGGVKAESLLLGVTPTFSGEPVELDSIRQRTVAGETFSFTRVSWLASGFALRRVDGSWLELTNQVAWFDLERGRSTFELLEVPADTYRGLRFDLGLDQTLNHADPAQFAANHPLNPNLNGLHWNWQGGYVFMALEGRWRNSDGPLEGWSYHLAHDVNRTRITVDADISLTNEMRLELEFDLAKVLSGPRALSFGRDGSSSHSRTGDPVAAAIGANLPGAFRLKRVDLGPRASVSAPAPKPEPLDLPRTFTPYPFQMSSVFPRPDLPRDNPLIAERVALGRKLFHEPALSKGDALSCASCHDSQHAFADPRRYSVGVHGQPGVRQAMPLFNLAWRSSFFWDGRAPSLRVQALMPIQDHAEMDESLTNVVAELTARIEYRSLFAAAFASVEISPERIGLAIESFLLTLTSFDSKFDRALRGRDQLKPTEQRGFELFMTEYDPRRGQYGADCFHCHGGPLFQSQTFANNGLDAEFSDLGRARITGRPSDAGKFATPSLRNVALTAPYMHDGRFNTLEEVVEHYSTGLKRSATLDPNLAKHPEGGIQLSPLDREALVAFLKTLTDDTLVASPGPRE